MLSVEKFARVVNKFSNTAFSYVLNTHTHTHFPHINRMARWQKGSVAWCGATSQQRKKILHDAIFVIRMSNTATIQATFLNTYRQTHPETYKEAEQKQAAQSSSAQSPFVRQKTIQVRFKRGKPYPGTKSTVISLIINCTLSLTLFRYH